MQYLRINAWSKWTQLKEKWTKIADIGWKSAPKKVQRVKMEQTSKTTIPTRETTKNNGTKSNIEQR